MSKKTRDFKTYLTMELIFQVTETVGWIDNQSSSDKKKKENLDNLDDKTEISLQGTQILFLFLLVCLLEDS